VIEGEYARAAYVFPRSYRRVFERLGCEEIRSVFITPTGPKKGPGVTARLFSAAT